MSLTDAEIRSILVKEKKRKRRKKRVRRRITLLVILIFTIVMAIGLFVNRDVLNNPILNRGVIYIDAGHGGEDPGSHTKYRKEKDDNLRLALAVKKQLNKKGFRVVMTRTTDVLVNRKDVGGMANDANAKLMISIHRNKAEDTRARGVEIWIPAKKDKVSKTLGNSIMSQLGKAGWIERQVRGGTLVDPTDDYYENQNSDMPSCLIEVGFLSNKKDNKLFDNQVNKNARAIARGIEKTYAKYYEKDKKEEK